MPIDDCTRPFVRPGHMRQTMPRKTYETPHRRPNVCVRVCFLLLSLIAGGEQGSAGDALLPATVQGAPQHVPEVAGPKAAAAAAGQVREEGGGG